MASDANTSTALPPLRAGRRPAGRALLGWMDDPRAPRVCRVAGSEGSGRTHLLAWLAAACPRNEPRPQRRVHALVDAGGASARGVLWALAARLGVGGRTVDELAVRLASGEGPLTVALTNLDGAVRPAEVVEQALLPLLAAVPRLRLVLEASAFPGDAAVLDLNDPQWTDAQQFAAWCGRLPGPGREAANAAYPNPGLALLAACSGASAPEAWWASVPEELRPVLGALAAAGVALTADQWVQLPGAVGPEAVRRASQLLPPEPDGISWRLSSPRLMSAVAPYMPEPRALVEKLRALTLDSDLATVLLRSVVACGDAKRELEDPRLLVLADPLAVTAAVEHRPDAAAQAWQLAGPAMLSLRTAVQRASVLYAYLMGRHEESVRRLEASTPWGGGWARWEPARSVDLGDTPGALLVEGDDGRVRRIDADSGRETEGEARPQTRPGGDLQGGVTWGQWTEQLHQGPVTSTDVTGVADGALVLSGGLDGRVRVWKPGGLPLAAPLDERPCPVSAVAVSTTPSGTLFVSAWADGAVGIRRLGAEDMSLDLHLGAQVRSAAVTGGGAVCLATADGLLVLRIRDDDAARRAQVAQVAQVG